MTSIYPDFFPDFHCKEDRCLHSCCAQPWDIAVDDKTAAAWLSWQTPLGEALRKALRHDRDGYHLIMKNGRCPLFENGLCRIVLEKGENALGYICHVHPRFYTYIGDYELSGTGLCCERTCEQLRDAGKLRFHVDGRDSPASLHDIFSLFGIDVPENYLAFTPYPEESYYRIILERLSETEPIDEKWTSDLKQMKDAVPAVVDAADQYEDRAPRLFFDAVYQYILYRAIEKALRYPLDVVIDYAAEMAEWIYMRAAAGADPLEAAARWSGQIEYDTDNMDILLQGLEEKS